MFFVYLIVVIVLLSPLALLAWFITSLINYIKQPKNARKQHYGMLIASSLTFIAFSAILIWLSIIGTKTISFM